MPYVQVPKDLTKVKTKLAFNLTKRQLVCFSAAAVVSVPVFLLTKNSIGTSNSMLLLVITALPFFLFAMYEKNGQPAEKIIKNIMEWRKRPKIRTYQTENLYAYLGCKKKGGLPIAKVAKAGKHKKGSGKGNSKKTAKKAAR